MPAYTVRYFDADRRTVVQERFVANSEEQLRDRLDEHGRVILGMEKAKFGSTKSRLARTNFQIAWWCRELRTLLVAGMTVVEALETIHAQTRDGHASEVNASLLRWLNEGQALSKAMRTTGAFPEVLVASVTAGERASSLINALDDYLRYYELLERLRRQVISAAIYPAVVATLGVLITIFLFLYVIPRFSQMYGNFHGAVSLPTKALLGVSGLLQAHFWAISMAAVGLAALAVFAWRQGRVMRVVLAMASALPPLRVSSEHFIRAKLYQSLALMFKGGYTLDEALMVCEGLALGGDAAQGISRTRIELARGRPVATAFTEGGLTDKVSARLLAVGQRTGGFEAILQTIADRHAQSFSTFIERATRLVEPLLLLTVALVVGGIVVMMYMPIFDIASSVR